MRLATALETMNKSQLQAYFQHWFPSDEMERSREALIGRLRQAMTDAGQICRRFEGLRTPEKGFIQALLLLEGCAGSVADIRHQRPARRIEDFEVENVLRRLKEQGFLHKAAAANGDGGRPDSFTIPEEMAEALQVTIDVEGRHPGELLSLAKARPRGTPGLGALAEIAAVRDRINGIDDPPLRAVLWSTLEDYSGILTLSTWRRAGSSGRLHRTPWRQTLEERHLGTTGILNLKDFGIDLEEEALTVYQEIVYAHALAAAETEGVENDVEFSVGADLVVDLSRLLQLLFIEPLELTRDGLLYKRTEEKLNNHFVLASYQSLFEGRLLEHLVALAGRLGLVVRREGSLRTNPTRVKEWEKREVLARAKHVFELFLDERGREHYSFHQRHLRRIFVELLSRWPAGRWLSVRDLVRAAVARFLLSLEKLGIARVFRDRQNGKFGAEAMPVPLERVQYDLYFWLVHRLALAGVVDLGYRRGHLHAVALSSVGAAVLGRETDAAGGGGLLVNPDFEILQLPGGARQADDAFTLNRFAERTGSDRVKRFRLTPESVKRAILAGMGLHDMLAFLENRAREPIPGNVSYTIREWAEGLELIRRERATVLRSRTPEGLDRLVEVLAEQEVVVERVGPTVALLGGLKADRAIVQLREKLREEGIYVD